MLDGQGELATATLEQHLRRGDGVAVVRAGEEMGQDLRVGVRRERDPFALELGAQREIVLDDAVVHEGHDAVGPARLRMGIHPVGHAVGRPARVADPGGAGQRFGIPGGRQVLDATRVLADVQGPVTPDRDARGIVAAVAEQSDALDQDGQRLGVARIADDAAHAWNRASLALHVTTGPGPRKQRVGNPPWSSPSRASAG